MSLEIETYDWQFTKICGGCNNGQYIMSQRVKEPITDGFGGFVVKERYSFIITEEQKKYFEDEHKDYEKGGAGHSGR